MTKRVSIFVCGILTFPGASRNWTGRAVTWTHRHTDQRAEKIEYFVGPISRAFGQRHRAHKLARTLEFYEGWDINLVGHSNGCDVILDTLREMPWMPIRSLHLISAACSADSRANGLDELLSGRAVPFSRPSEPIVQRATVYIAGRDRALLLAGTITGKALGYGTLGRTGPVIWMHPVHVVKEPAYGHSDWFTPDNFDSTMKNVTA